LVLLQEFITLHGHLNVKNHQTFDCMPFNFCCSCEFCAFSKNSPNCMHILKSVYMLFPQRNSFTKHMLWTTFPACCCTANQNANSVNVNFVASDQLTPSCVYGALCAGTPLQSGHAVRCFCSQDWQSKD